MPAFAAKLYGTVACLRKFDALFYEILYLRRAGFDYRPDGVLMAEAVACYERVPNVGFKIVGGAGYACYAALGVVCVCVGAFFFCKNCDLVSELGSF